MQDSSQPPVPVSPVQPPAQPPVQPREPAVEPVPPVHEATPTTQPQYISKSTPQAELRQSKLEQFKEFIVECRRVLRITKKPDRQEFTTIVKISGLGMLIIGVLGFLISVLKEALF
ncbi:protein translocase SEC61 complex subunit gamma [Candidatus Woesearchaeota archaeon]|nr:protein translocase SEC61 complex subunit gamma [Candidatus Woesearchaeota archaeon]